MYNACAASRLVLARRLNPRRNGSRPWRALQICPAGRRRHNSSFVAASALVQSESQIDAAAMKLIETLQSRLVGLPDCVLWFAKGYGAQSLSVVGPLLRKRLGTYAVIVGSASEAGLIGDGSEVQEETFALSALAFSSSKLQVYPFFSPNIGSVPSIGRGGQWAALKGGKGSPCIVAFCAMPMVGDPQGWVTLLDHTLAHAQGGDELPLVVGGLPVGNHVFIDGEVHAGGAFGLVLEAVDGASFEPIVAQGTTPFGPWLEITGVEGDHMITSLNGKSPQEVLEPLLHGPAVPGRGNTMAGIFVDPTPVSRMPSPAATAQVAAAAMGGRPNCLIRPLHRFMPDGSLVLTPLTEVLPYAKGMKMQLQCYNAEHAMDDLRSRAEHDLMLNGGRPPDAAIVVACGARGISLYGEEGVESDILRQTWKTDVPTVGIFAGGEIGPVGLKTYMHSYTTSCLMLRG